MALVRWNRPELSISDEATGRRRNLDQITWREVLDAVGKVEMDLRRLHTSEKLSSGRDLTGAIEVRFLRDRTFTKLVGVTTDPGLEAFGDKVAAIVVGADFHPSPTAMVIDLTCTFESEGGSVGWDPGGGGDDWGGGGRDDRAFGDPF